MTRSRRAGPLLAAAALLALALPAAAREDDVDFALGLADRGYEDLANREIDRMLEGSPTPEKRENAEYTRCMLLRRIALATAGNARSEPREVRAKFAAASKAFDNFLKAYPRSRLKAEAEFNMANLMKDFAYYLVQNVEKFEAKEQEGIRQEASKTFDEAIRYLQGIRDREEEKDKDKPEEDDTKYDERNKAWYYLSVAMHDRAMLHPPGDALRIQQLTQAIEETTRLLEAEDGSNFGYLAGWWLGQEYWHRAELQKGGWSAEDIRQARDWFSGPIDVADFPNIEQEWPGAVEICLKAAYDYGRMCNQVGVVGEGADRVSYPELFVKKAEHLEEKLAGIKNNQFGLQVLVEKARAMQTLGMAEGAVSLLNQVSNWAQNADPTWGRAVDQVAKRALNEVLAGIPSDSPLQIGPDVLMKAGDGSLRERKFGRAIRAYQRVLSAIETDPDADRRKSLFSEYWGDCWRKINESYGHMDRWLEAFHAADFPVQRYLAEKRTDPDPDIENLVQYRIFALEALNKRLPADTPKDVRDDLVDRIKKAREMLTEKFPWIQTDVAYLVASNKVNAANTLMNAGETQRAIEKFKEAIDDFNKLDPQKSKMYETAQSRIGECYVGMKQPEAGLKYLQAFIAKNIARWKDPAAQAALKQPWGYSLFWIANAYDGLNQPARVVETLEGFEKTFEGAKLDNFAPRVRYLRTVALVKAGRGEEAVKEADRLRKENTDSPWTPLASSIVGRDLKARSDRAHSAGDAKAALELKKRAVDFYDFWLRRAGSVEPEQLVFVGELNKDIGVFDRAAELWQRALDDYEKQGKKEKAEAVIINLSSLLVGQGRFAEALPKFEALFIKTPEDIQPLRTCLEALRQVPTNVDKAAHFAKLKKVLEAVAVELARDPAGAAQAGEARKAAADPERMVETLARAYSETPELRRALARALALTILGYDAAMSPDLKNSVFMLVKRSPELMSNLARCYEELGKADPANAIRAVNLYSTLVEAAPEGDIDNPAPGSKYTERWFEWKYRWAKVALATGKEFKFPDWLQMVCSIVRGMETLNELDRADKERAGFSKDFRALKDEADAALRGLGKEGCK